MAMAPARSSTSSRSPASTARRLGRTAALPGAGAAVGSGRFFQGLAPITAPPTPPPSLLCALLKYASMSAKPRAPKADAGGVAADSQGWTSAAPPGDGLCGNTTTPTAASGRGRLPGVEAAATTLDATDESDRYPPPPPPPLPPPAPCALTGVPAASLLPAAPEGMTSKAAAGPLKPDLVGTGACAPGDALDDGVPPAWLPMALPGVAAAVDIAAGGGWQAHASGARSVQVMPAACSSAHAACAWATAAAQAATAGWSAGASVLVPSLMKHAIPSSMHGCGAVTGGMDTATRLGAGVPPSLDGSDARAGAGAGAGADGLGALTTLGSETVRGGGTAPPTALATVDNGEGGATAASVVDGGGEGAGLAGSWMAMGCSGTGGAPSLATVVLTCRGSSGVATGATVLVPTVELCRALSAATMRCVVASPTPAMDVDKPGTASAGSPPCRDAMRAGADAINVPWRDDSASMARERAEKACGAAIPCVRRHRTAEHAPDATGHVPRWRALQPVCRALAVRRTRASGPAARRRGARRAISPAVRSTGQHAPLPAHGALLQRGQARRNTGVTLLRQKGGGGGERNGAKTSRRRLAWAVMPVADGLYGGYGACGPGAQPGREKSAISRTGKAGYSVGQQPPRTRPVAANAVNQPGHRVRFAEGRSSALTGRAAASATTPIAHVREAGYRQGPWCALRLRSNI
jgi:hypothetical protein